MIIHQRHAKWLFGFHLFRLGCRQVISLTKTPFQFHDVFPTSRSSHVFSAKITLAQKGWKTLRTGQGGNHDGSRYLKETKPRSVQAALLNALRIPPRHVLCCFVRRVTDVVGVGGAGAAQTRCIRDPGRWVLEQTQSPSSGLDDVRASLATR